MKYRLILTFLITTIFWANAQTSFEKDLDKFVKDAMARFPEVPGLSIAVVKGDQTLFVKGYGWADREQKIEAKKSTPFYIASTTKSFMGMVSVILEEEGKLDLNAPLTTYKPFKDLKNKAMFEQITISDLLNHTSGIENGFLTFRDAYTGDKSADIMTMLLEETTEKKEKGKIFQYDNLGYNILDVLLEKELGLNWRDLLDEKIFKPLKMKHTSAYISEGERKKWKMAWPYMSPLEGEAKRADLMKDDSMMQAAGGLICSAEDAANWLLFNVNAGKLGRKQIYPVNLVTRTHTALTHNERDGQIFKDTGYGLGWFTAKFKEEDIVYHFGGYSGFFSHISFMPKNDIGIAVFANESFFGDNLSNVIATYAYDYLTNGIQPDDYEASFTQLRKMVTRLHGGFAKDIEKRSGRKWQLSQPMDAYEGSFYNKYLGTLEVKVVNNEVRVSLGKLNTTAEPYPKDEAMRVMLVPLRGEALSFTLEGDQVKSAKYKGVTFKRVN